MNTMLPGDIRVSASREVDEAFHPRFMAAGKIYRYRMYDGPHAMAMYRYRAAHCIYPLDEQAMAEALEAAVACCRVVPAELGEHIGDYAAIAAAVL